MPLESRIQRKDEVSIPLPVSVAAIVHVAESPATAYAGPVIFPVGSVAS
jgi:hypothetical protein